MRDGHYYSNSVRIEAHKDWIKTIYPDVRFLSKEFFEWGNNGRKGSIGDLYENHNINTGEREISAIPGVC